MLLSRRYLLRGLAGAGALSGIAAPYVARARQMRVTQSELDEAIVQHDCWFEDCRTGKGAVFANRDLSGLNFSATKTNSSIWPERISPKQIYLKRLRGLFVETGFVAANLTRADLSDSWFLPEPTTFYSADLTRAKSCRTRLSAVRFSSAIYTGTDFTDAEIDPRAAYAMRQSNMI